MWRDYGYIVPNGTQKGGGVTTISCARASLAYGYALLTPVAFAKSLNLMTLALP